MKQAADNFAKTIGTSLNWGGYVGTFEPLGPFGGLSFLSCFDHSSFTLKLVLKAIKASVKELAITHAHRPSPIAHDAAPQPNRD